MNRISSPSTAKQGNVKKHDSYREAWARIKKAKEDRYFIEASAILESIISDRMLSKLHGKYDFPLRKGRNKFRHSLSDLIKEAKKQESQDKDGDETLWCKVDKWRKSRNEIIHGLVKSDPGTPTVDVKAFLDKAEECCSVGEELSRKIDDWSRRI